MSLSLTNFIHSKPVTEFFLHFFPLLTIFLFCLVALLFIFHVNAIRKIEKHIASNRPEEWEELGKPSIFSGRSSENAAKFRAFMEAESTAEAKDIQAKILWERSKNIRSKLVLTTWSAFGMYIFTIFAVHYLIERLAILFR